VSSRNGTQTGRRLKDMTPADILVLADQAKDKGLGVTPLDPKDPSQQELAYLCYCPWDIETAFAQVFPHLFATVRRFNGYGGRDTYLFEEAALLAVLKAFGLDPARLAWHVHGWRNNTYVRVLKRRRWKVPAPA
jgi:hypothetical protein